VDNMVKSKTITLSNVAKRHAELRRANKIEIIFLYAWVGALFLSLVSCLLYVIIFDI
jgi:hypothetical protein